MAQNSKIEWTDHTFNPWIGCTKVSDGCKNCYAEAMMDKRYGKVKWGVQGRRIRTSATYWNQPLKWDRKAGKEGKRARVFCASLADVFEDKPDQPEMDKWRTELFQLIQDTPNLDWLLLTKRPENVMGMVNSPWYYGLPNVWIGTSVENQEQYDKRSQYLRDIPAAVTFYSMEPLLGSVIMDKDDPVSWVIVGGESGPNARPMHPDWARSLRDQCQAAGVPFLFKQWGEWVSYGYEDSMTEFRRKDMQLVFGYIGKPRAWVRRVGKHAAGRLLDGREWNEFPEEVIPQPVETK